MGARGLWREINNFFSSTSIHGFPYISTTQSRSTRFIWTLIVLAGFGVASYFLYNTVDGFSTKYVSTTIETRSIKQFEFPAVTFHAGTFNSRNAFLRVFLNEFEFTRYSENSLLRDNYDHSKLYQWITSPMNNALFENIEEHLLREKATENHKTFIQSKKNIFKNEVCSLVALHNDKISLKRDIRRTFSYNMYKYREFRNSMNFIRNEIGSIIQTAVQKQNITAAEIKKACNDLKNQETKTKMEVLLLSYFFLFIDKKNTNVGAGDLATGPYLTRLLSHDGYSQYWYVPTHTVLTNMFNAMVNATLPVSVTQIPLFFVLPDKQNSNGNKDEGFIRNNINSIDLINITEEAMRNYHFLWNTYNNYKENFTIFCENIDKINCSVNHLNYVLAENLNDKVNAIKKHPLKGKIVEGKASSPPCSNNETIQKFKLGSICNFLKNIADNKEAFLKIMKFAKQRPVYLEDDEEYLSIFQKEIMTLYGFNGMKNKVCLKHYKISLTSQLIY